MKIKEEKGITLLALIVIILVVLVILTTIIICVYNSKSNNDEIMIKNEIAQENITNEVKEEIEEEINNENIKNVIVRTGLREGEGNGTKIYFENDEYFVSSSLLENIIADNVKIVYNENIIRAYFDVENHQEENTFLTINLDTEIISGRSVNGGEFESEKMLYQPIIENEEIYLPLKYILNKVKPWDLNIYYEEDLGILRLHLEDFEYEFLKDFPYNIKGTYAKNMASSYYQSIDISKEGVIYENNNKYGIVSYNVEEYKEDLTPKGKYLGYNIELEAKYDEIEFIPYDYEIYILKKDNKNIIYDRENKKLSEEYDLVEKIENTDNYKVGKNGKYGIYGETEIIYDDIWYEQGQTTGNTTKYTKRGIYGNLNGEKVLIKELEPLILDY